MRPRDKMAAEMRALMQEASQELAKAGEELITALFALTTKYDDQNRKRFQTALQAVSTAPKIGPKDAEIMKKMEGTLAKAANTLDNTITKKAGYDLNRELTQSVKVIRENREQVDNKAAPTAPKNRPKP